MSQKHTLLSAINCIYTAHSGQIDKAGKDYYAHLITVMGLVTCFCKMASNQTHQLMLIAALHDVLEDSDIFNKEDLTRKFGEQVATCVDILTKKDRQNKINYMSLVKSRWETTLIKLADAMHNSMVDRFDNPTKKDIERCLEYKKTAFNLFQHLTSEYPEIPISKQLLSAYLSQECQ